MTDDPLSPIKVNYQRKTEVRIEQPEDVTRAKASAWLDVISPITHWAGLKGDALKHKRDLMRLEKEATLFEISQKLKVRLEGKAITPIPANQLIPALEKASLEPPDGELVERWAALLASGATDPGDDVLACVSILGDLGANEAQLLQRMRDTMAEYSEFSREALWEERTTVERYVDSKRDQLWQLASHLQSRDVPGPSVSDEVLECLSDSPVVFSRVLFQAAGLNWTARRGYSFDEQISWDILRYRNLIEPRFASTSGTYPDVTMYYQSFTTLGFRFIERVC